MTRKSTKQKTKTPRADAWREQFEAQFLTAYDEQADALFRHVSMRVRDREVALDIVQETFLRAWRYASEGNQIEYMRAFLYRVANNLIVDTSRKHRTSSLEKMMEEDGFEIEDDMAKDPADIPQARQAVALLKSLDEIYRTAITMRFIDQLSPKEIATKLGVSENVVSVRIHRGVARLAKMMERENVEAAY